MEELLKQTPADTVCMNETLFDGQAEQGIEIDHVLPDYYPEIFKIIKCCVTPRVTSTAISGGKLIIDGCAVIRILYLTENSNALNCVEQRYTWSKSVDIGKTAVSQYGEPVITVIPRTDYCNCRAISSRRVEVRGAVSFRINITCGTKFTVPSMPSEMQVLSREVPCTSEPIFSDTQATVREEIETGARGVEFIVSCDAVPHITDTKIIANKAVIKGIVTVSALYGVHTDEHAGCDELEKMTADIPVSRIIDMPGLTENHSLTPKLAVKSCELTPKADSGVLSCEIVLGCRCAASCPATAEIPCDVYSTEYEYTCKAVQLRVPSAPRSLKEQFTIKTGIFCGSEIESVWDCRAELCSVVCRADGNTTLRKSTPKGGTDAAQPSVDENAILVSGVAYVQAVGRYSGGLPFFEEKQEPFEQRIAADKVAGNTVVTHREAVTQTGFAIRSDGSLDVTVGVELSAELSDFTPITAISDAALLEDKPKEKCGDYSLRICCTDAGESCWDIAKRCNADVEAVMSENGITDRTAELSGMIVIPMV